MHVRFERDDYNLSILNSIIWQMITKRKSLGMLDLLL